MNHKSDSETLEEAFDRHFTSGHRCPGVPNTTCHDVTCRKNGCIVERGLAWGPEFQPEEKQKDP